MSKSLWILLPVVTLTTPAIAQAQGELVPKALAEALLSSRGEGKTSIVVGALPPSLQPKLALPADAKVMGGTDSQSGASAIILLDGPLNAAAERFHAEVIKRGWEPEDQGPQRFGGDFIDAPVGQRRPVSGGRPDTYCGRAGTLLVRYEPDGFAQTRVIVATTGDNRCAMMRDAMLSSRSMGPEGRMRAPILINPPQARLQDYGSACSGQFNSTSGGPGALLSSTISPAEILAHYAKQLADSGWKESGSGVSASWSRADSAGSVREYQITITTTSANPMCRKVEAELRSRR
jgi:hypothetical protein